MSLTQKQIDRQIERNIQFAGLIHQFAAQASTLADQILATPTRIPLPECRGGISAAQTLANGFAQFVAENEQFRHALSVREAVDQVEAGSPVNDIGGFNN